MKKIIFAILMLLPFMANSITPVFCCGFECGVTGAHWTPSLNTSFSTSIVRSGSRSGRANPTSSTGALTSTAFPSSSLFVIRCYVYFATLPNATCELITTNAAPGSRVGAYFNSSDNKIYAGNSTSNLGATGVTVSTGQWFRIDVKIDVSTSSWLIDVSVDGTSCGQRNNSAAPTSYTWLNLGTLTDVTQDIFFDDFIMSNTLTDYPIGAGVVYHFVPVSDGTHNVPTSTFFRGTTSTQITNSTTDAYQLIDEVPLDGTTPATNDYIAYTPNAANNSTKYIECKFGAALGILTPTVAPRAVEVIVMTHQAGTGASTWDLKLNDNGTESSITSCTQCTGFTIGKYARKQYATPPSGGSWNSNSSGNGAFNNIRIRYGYTDDGNPDHYFDCAMIEAEFPEPHRILIISKR
jgi:hypothetical protein